MSNRERVIRVRFVGNIVFGIFMLLSLSAVGAVYNWDNGSGDGKWATATNWNSTELDNTVPQSDDTTYIGVNPGVLYGTSVVYQAGAVSGNIMLGYNSSTKGELQINGGALTVGGNLNIGWSGTGVLSVVSGQLQVNQFAIGQIAGKPGGTLIQDGGLISCSVLEAGLNAQGGVIQNGGTNVVSSSLRLGRFASGPGLYMLNGGELKPKYLYIGNGTSATGIVQQTAGLLNITNSNVFLSYAAGSFGKYKLDGGKISTVQAIVGSAENSTGVFIQTGGTNSMRDLIIGSYGTGSYYLTGGVLEIGRGSSSGYISPAFRGPGSLYIGNSNSTGVVRSYPGTANTYLTLGWFASAASNGVVRGWGIFNLIGSINNSGRIIADGYGTDRDLDFSEMSYVTYNSFANTTSNGWYAVNHGRLILPSTLSANPTYWGERGNQDLVNSVKFDLSGIDSIDGSLLATDHGAVSNGLFKPVGVWEFGNVSKTGTMTFLYDVATVADVGIEENRLYVWKYSGGAWQDVTAVGGLDTAANTITTISVDPNGMFAVAPKRIGTVIIIK